MLNRVILMGRLVYDPELKTTTSGVSVTTFRIAVDRSYVKAGAQRQADFFDIVAWRGTAEFICTNFAKGSLIAIDGQLQSRQYQAKDGTNRTIIEVVADNVSFTGERRNNTNEGNYTPAPNNAVQTNSEPNTQPASYDYPHPNFNEFEQMPLDDDLPF